MEKTLMHTCCAPCSVSCIQQLRSEGIEPVAYWYQPQHPPLSGVQGPAGHADGLRALPSAWSLSCRRITACGSSAGAVGGDIDHRCSMCYALRLAQSGPICRPSTAMTASPPPCSSAPTRTMSCWRRQRSAWAGSTACRFLYRDFRPGFRQGQQEARALGFYMQKYCGCVFSEEDRYQKQILRDQKEPEKHILPS